MRGARVKPSKEIEALMGADPAFVRRHFELRAKKLSREIASLPLSEQLRAAADMLDAPPTGRAGLQRFAMQIAQHVAAELAKLPGVRK